MFGRRKDRDSLREIMVREQLEARGITDPRVLEAFRTLPREEFLPAFQRKHAYEDRPIPIGSEQTLSQPYITALMTQSLEVRPGSKVLEIGTGSGFQTAVLAMLASEVWTLEVREDLAQRAQDNLHGLGFGENIHFLSRDGSLGLDEESPFDRILVTAAAPVLPTPLIEQLGPDGILILPVGSRELQRLLKVRKTPGRFIQEELCGCVFVPLTGLGGFQD